MPEQIPRPAPDEPIWAWTPPPRVWETGEVPDDSRVPGTRRLWLAGGLAMGVLVASMSAIALQERDTTTGATDRGGPAAAAQPLLPDVSLPPAAPSAKAGLSGPQESPSEKDTSGKGASEKQQGGAEDGPGAGSADPSSDGGRAGDDADHDGGDDGDGDGDGDKDGKKPPAPSSDRTSVRSVNFPDRHWRVSKGFVRLDQVGRSSPSSVRQDSSFRVVKGLAKTSCYSFATADGTYLRHRNFVLRSERNDGSYLFRQDATFCPRSAYGSSGVMLEAVNYPGRFLRHRNFTLRLEGYDRSQSFWWDSAFRLVDGLA